MKWYKLYLDFCWNLVSGVAKETWYAVKITASDFSNNMEAGSLKQEVERAQTALGEKMYQTGLGEQHLREKIAAKDREIHEAESAKASTRQLVAEKQALISELAAGAFSQPRKQSLPELELKAVEQAQEALRKHEVEVAATKSTRQPVNWRMACVGFGLIGVFVLLVGVSERSKPKDGAATGGRPDEQVTAATGGRPDEQATKGAKQETRNVSLKDGPIPISSLIAELSDTHFIKWSTPEDGSNVAGTPYADEWLAVLRRFDAPYRFHIGSMSGAFKQKLTVVLLQAGLDKRLVQVVIAHNFDIRNPNAPENDHNEVIRLVENDLLPGIEYRKHFRAEAAQIIGSRASLRFGKALVVTQLAGKELQVSITVDAPDPR